MVVYELLCGDAIEVMRTLPAESVHVCVTSPPYYGLRWYGVDGQFGMEPTLAEYVENMVAVFREVRRVLRGDGTLWLNLGDSYANDGKWGGESGGKMQYLPDEDRKRTGREKRTTGLPPKNLMGVPWRVAFALQEDGWYLRSDVIWHKPNAHPESVTDRPTKTHEYLFLLSKSEQYFYDVDAVREPQQSLGERHEGKSGYREGHPSKGGIATRQLHPSGRNRRSVWTVAVASYDEAHFATYPPKLVEPCILASTSARGVCPSCGAPWVRVTEKTFVPQGDIADPAKLAKGSRKQLDASNGWSDVPRGSNEIVTLGWRPSCACDFPGMRADDWEIIYSPLGTGGNGDPSQVVGRAGMARQRSDDGGRRPMHRYQQRQYAAQLRRSPHRDDMAAEAGPEAFAHYTRTDRTGSRAIPADMLETWLSRGWLVEVSMPDYSPVAPVPAVVVDPFSGSGSTGVAALSHGRHYIGIDLNPLYIEMSRRRIGGTQPALGLA